MGSYRDILKSLTNLSAAELQRISDAVGALTGMSRPRDGGIVPQTDETPGADHERWLLDAIVAEAERNGEFTTVWQLQRSTYIKEFRRNLPGLMKFFRQHQLTRTEQFALMRLAVRLWYDYRSGLPANARLFLQQGNVPAILNMCFPGYARNGLIRLIISKAPKEDKDHVRK